MEKASQFGGLPSVRLHTDVLYPFTSGTWNGQGMNYGVYSYCLEEQKTIGEDPHRREADIAGGNRPRSY